MKKNNIMYIIIFLVLIILIFVVCIFTNYKNKPLKNVDRKVEYIFKDLTYDNVLNMSKYLFENAIKLVKNDFDYEKNNHNEIIIYSINNYNNYKKIVNYSIISSTLKKYNITNYLETKKILKYNNNYYIESYENNYNFDYVGSIIDIKNYGNYYVNLKSVNYYCKNYNYKGVLDAEPNCDFQKEETYFTVSLENSVLKINNLEEIAKILQ